MPTAKYVYRLILIVALFAFSATAAGRVLPGGPSSVKAEKPGSWTELHRVWTPPSEPAPEADPNERGVGMMHRAWDLDVDY